MNLTIENCLKNFVAKFYFTEYHPTPSLRVKYLAALE